LSAPPPSLLAENAGLAFIGEKPWTPALLNARLTRFIEHAPNPTGRPNSDVLRRFIGLKSGLPHERWQVDFPPYSTEQEAALYVEPCRQLRSQLDDFAGQWWLSPHARTALRTAVARLERYLATPLAGDNPAWNWVDSNLLPDDSLLIVARDDDFTYGLLRSQTFRLWWGRHAPHLSLVEVVSTFPFPWAPATLLSSLTREQEEHRMAVTRAARGVDQARIDSAVSAAYGWPGSLADDETLAHLAELNRRRAG
jgi:hypothetical protein